MSLGSSRHCQASQAYRSVSVLYFSYSGDVTTTSRLLNLLSLLQATRDWPGSLLADRLHVSPRTVRRDIERLREMGYTIETTMGPDGGYRLDAGSELPPLLFDDDQLVAVTVALQAATATGAGIAEDALRALTTMRQVMPSRLRHRLDSVDFTVLLSGPGDASPETASPQVLTDISAAIRAREMLRFDYERPGASPSTEPAPPIRVEPHHLVAARGRWYLLAWAPEREGWRIFRADRISPRTPNGPRFVRREIPGGDAGEYVSARFKGSEQANRWPCTGTVMLHRPAREVIPFAGDGLVEEIDSERCTLEAGSWSWVALAAALSRFDSDIEVIRPRELKDGFAQLAVRSATAAA